MIIQIFVLKEFILSFSVSPILYSSKAWFGMKVGVDMRNWPRSCYSTLHQ